MLADFFRFYQAELNISSYHKLIRVFIILNEQGFTWQYIYIYVARGANPHYIKMGSVRKKIRKNNKVNKKKENNIII